jgi:hypothetical protein
MKQIVPSFALLSVLILTSCGSESSSPSLPSPTTGSLTNNGARPVQSRQLKNLKYSLKSNLDFTLPTAEKKKALMFKGRREASEETWLSYSFLLQRGVSSTEADQAASACTISTLPQKERAPIFARTGALEMTDFGVLTTAESSSFQMILKEDIGMSLKIRCRNVTNQNELEAQIGHLFQIGR